MPSLSHLFLSIWALFVSIVPTVSPTPIPPRQLLFSYPPSYLIKTAFIQQAPEKNWDQPWQDSCEEAALLTVDYFYRQLAPSLKEQKQAILKMIEYENSRGFAPDVNLLQMAQIASEYLNYQTKIIDQPILDHILSYLVKNIPVIVPVSCKTLFQENHHFNNGGPWYHHIVILGYDHPKGQFIVHDVGTRFGAYYRYSYNLLLSSIHDFPPSLKKEDIARGNSRVLILLQ